MKPEIYRWSIPEAYPDSLIVRYQRDQLPHYLEFMKGKALPAGVGPVRFRTRSRTQVLQRWDVLENDAGVPLVNARTLLLLTDCAGADFQAIETVIDTRDGEVTDYTLLNITQVVMCLDHARSEYVLFPNTNTPEIQSFTRITYLPKCMGPHSLARNAEYEPDILVAPLIRDAFRASRIRGVKFVTP